MDNCIIYSSSEALETASEIQNELTLKGVQSTRWDQHYRSGFLLSSLLSDIDDFRFAIFILASDDKIQIRNKGYNITRDNVLFELGLWLSKAGQERAFIVYSSDYNLRIPSDLAGLLMIPYKKNAPFKTQVGLIVAKIINNLSKVESSAVLPPRVGIIPYDVNEQFRRYATSRDRISTARRGEEIKFIAMTGRNIICPELRQTETNYFFEAIRRGVHFKGIVVDTESEQARLRSDIETPQLTRNDRLIFKDSAIVREWMETGYKQNVTKGQRDRLQLKYSRYPLTFSLWLFDDFAVLEPYHYGKQENMPHLCGFSMIKMDAGSQEYGTVKLHFDVLWERCASRA